MRESSSSSSSSQSAASASPASLVSGAGAGAGAAGAAGESRFSEAWKQLFCGGVAGSAAKTVTAPFSRLTILFQVHSLVSHKKDRPKYAMTLFGPKGAFAKTIERGGIWSLWKGNMTSVLHRFPFSAINFYVYEHTMDLLSERKQQLQPRRISRSNSRRAREEPIETSGQLVRRVTSILETGTTATDTEEETGDSTRTATTAATRRKTTTRRSSSSTTTTSTNKYHPNTTNTAAAAADTTAGTGGGWHSKFVAGALAGTTAVLCCYPLDLVRTRLTTELEGHERYHGSIRNCFSQIARNEGFAGFYAGIAATLGVAVPSFAISYTVYGTLKEYTLEDELFYNLRRIDAESGETKLGFLLTILCGACSGGLATVVTFPMDTIRRRMQIQNLHLPPDECLSSGQQFYNLITKEGLRAVYRGLTPELIKVVPMVGTMFVVYEWTRDILQVRTHRR